MDLSIRAISAQHNLKISIVSLGGAMKEITLRQETNPLASLALSRITIANALLGLEFKNNELSTSNFSTSDGLAKIIISEYQNGHVRSYLANPHFEVEEIKASPNLDELISQVVGKDGTLTISHSMLKNEPYVSQVSLTGESIDLDYMQYLKDSNQIDSFIATCASFDENNQINQAVGILLQLFPGYKEEDLDYLAKMVGSSQYFCDVLLKTTNYTALIEEMADDAIILETKELDFQCTCSREKTIMAIKLLGKETLADIFLKNEPIEVICDFCKTKYIIEVDELLKTEK